MVVAWEQSHMHVRGTTSFISLWGVHLNLVFPFLLCDRRKGNKIIRTHHHMGRTWLVLEKSSNKIFTTEHLCWGRYHYLIWKYVPNIEEINHLLVWFSFLVNHFWTIRACDLSVHITCLEEKRNIMFFSEVWAVWLEIFHASRSRIRSPFFFSSLFFSLDNRVVRPRLPVAWMMCSLTSLIKAQPPKNSNRSHFTLMSSHERDLKTECTC